MQAEPTAPSRLRFAVLGPGGVGGFVAAALARASQPVTVVAREPTAELIAARGIRVESVLHGSYVARPPAVSYLDEPVDVLLVATKAAGLAAALERIGERAVAGAVVAPLLNGIEHMELLRERFGRRVAAGTIRIEADRPEPGTVVQTSRFGLVELASDGDVPRERLEAIAAALGAAGVRARVGASEAAILWDKLVRLGALAITTSAADRPIGPIRSDPEWRARLLACIEEAAAVAAAEGAPVDPATVAAELDAAHQTLGSSMQRDIAAGRPPELEEIPGAVIRAAARHGLACPAIEALTAEIRARIAGRPVGV